MSYFKAKCTKLSDPLAGFKGLLLREGRGGRTGGKGKGEGEGRAGDILLRRGGGEGRQERGGKS